MRTIAQKRAAFALKRVLAVSDRKEFKPFSAGAPSMILQNGLGQTMAFWLAKGTKEVGINQKDKHIELFDTVKDWLSLSSGDVHNRFTTATDRTGFIQELTAMDLARYLAAQNETLALLEWVKRFANADLT